jgi:hypothetical protein
MYQFALEHTPYGGLNKNGSFILMKSDTIREYGLTGVGVALLEEVCLSHFLLPVDSVAELSTPSASTMSAYMPPCFLP